MSQQRPPVPTAGVTLHPVAFDAAEVGLLLAALDAELVARYDNADEVFPPHVVADYAPPRGTFLLAVRDGEPVGCGGLRPGPGPATGEVKRMFVAPPARGRGIAGRLLQALVQAAGGLGYRQLVLETGLRQPEAIALYEGAGWTRVAPYGHYRDSPLSVCFSRSVPA